MNRRGTHDCRGPCEALLSGECTMTLRDESHLGRRELEMMEVVRKEINGGVVALYMVDGTLWRAFGHVWFVPASRPAPPITAVRIR